MNDTTFQGDGKVAYVPAVVNAKLTKPSRADRIRSMTDEELADRIMGFIRCEACEREFHIECNPLKTCRGIWLDWLKEEEET